MIITGRLVSYSKNPFADNSVTVEAVSPVFCERKISWTKLLQILEDVELVLPGSNRAWDSPLKTSSNLK